MVGCNPDDYKNFTDKELVDLFLAPNTACVEQAVGMEMERRGLFNPPVKEDK